MKDVDISVLVGKTLSYISKTHEEIYFKVSETERYKMYHEQDCCESVIIEDICGELEWLIGEPILRAVKRTDEDRKNNVDEDESFTWTFYELATIKGSVTIRWYGTSNGYYSESVDFVRMENDD